MATKTKQQSPIKVKQMPTYLVPPTQIVQLSGHRNIQSVNSYSHISEEQHREMNRLLVAQSAPASNTTSTSGYDRNSSLPPDDAAQSITNNWNEVLFFRRNQQHFHWAHIWRSL
jgi:hypothetical protein